MSLLEGRVNILSASSSASAPINRTSSDLPVDANDALGNLRSIQGLFAAPVVHDEAQRRAHKRRKVDDDRAVPVQNADADADAGEDEQSIILANISLELVSLRVPLQRRLIDCDLRRTKYRTLCSHLYRWLKAMSTPVSLYLSSLLTEKETTPSKLLSTA
jgi:hypothetical protein